jgi:ANTAR domain-containing protein/GAF domain-containing protein
MVSDLDPMEFARLAEALQSPPSSTRTVEEIVDYVRQQLYADHVGITLIRGGRLETVAATSDIVRLVDAFQHELDEGPGRDASWHRHTLLIEDLTDDGRWPEWASAVTTLGVASVLAAELRGHGARRLGSINVYCTQRRTFTDDDIAFVSIFARHAAITLAESLHESGLCMAMDSRKLIGQAEGLLMERHGLDASGAFEVLLHYSRDHNIKLRYVAEHLLAARELPAPGAITNGAENTMTDAKPNLLRSVTTHRPGSGRSDSTAGAVHIV